VSFQKKLKLKKNILLTRLVFNALISISLIYFSIKVNIDVAFFKKKKKNTWRRGPKVQKKIGTKVILDLLVTKVARRLSNWKEKNKLFCL
jgi:hypothetical protein